MPYMNGNYYYKKVKGYVDYTLEAIENDPHDYDIKLVKKKKFLKLDKDKLKSKNKEQIFNLIVNITKKSGLKVEFLIDKKNNILGFRTIYYLSTDSTVHEFAHTIYKDSFVSSIVNLTEDIVCNNSDLNTPMKKIPKYKLKNRGTTYCAKYEDNSVYVFRLFKKCGKYQMYINVNFEKECSNKLFNNV